MGDIDVDFFLKTLKELIMSSKVELIIKEKQQLESLEEEIKYMRGFLKVTEKKRNEHSKVMNLVRWNKDVVSEAEKIIELFVVQAFKANQNQDHLTLDLDFESVKKEIKTLTAMVLLSFLNYTTYPEAQILSDDPTPAPFDSFLPEPEPLTSPNFPPIELPTPPLSDDPPTELSAPPLSDASPIRRSTRIWRMIDLIYRPEEKVLAELGKFKSHMLTCPLDVSENELIR
ncbi:hypothetical protein RHGRI_004012 [Rhododendron griersonianum]|uniref:Disease resistance N-terminal domain-containing protein n=1 Tax=Rhododendron griersonianum TaxID=479676 RepID=A0AAV6L903_9ERIC|nr:hypothetical protein RHGRI_004012 [Rhododendron griersonianum]